jgi:hypothetical protein
MTALLADTNAPVQMAGLGAAAPPVGSDELKNVILKLISEAADTNVQVEASRLMNSIAELAAPNRPSDLMLIESAIAALRAKKPNVEVAKFARNRIEIVHRNERRGFVPWISRRLSDSPVYAMLVGVVFSALVWAIAFGTVHAVGALWKELGGSNFIMPPAEANPLAFAAFVGSLVSLLSRVDTFANLYIFDPFLVFLNSFLKPLIGTALALTIYAVLKSGIVQISGLSLAVSDDGYRYIFWVFGFLAGFSERLTSDFIARAETVVGRSPDSNIESKG